MLKLQERLKVELLRYLESGDGLTLASILEENPRVLVSDYGEYPDYHRILDLSLKGKSYRVCRQISRGEELFFSEVQEKSIIDGVPLWLTGEKLQRWANDEENDPSDVPTDWNIYK